MNVDVTNVRIVRHRGIDDVVYLTVVLPDTVTTHMQVRVAESTGFQYIHRLLGGQFKLEEFEFSISKQKGA